MSRIQLTGGVPDAEVPYGTASEGRNKGGEGYPEEVKVFPRRRKGAGYCEGKGPRDVKAVNEVLFHGGFIPGREGNVKEIFIKAIPVTGFFRVERCSFFMCRSSLYIYVKL